MTTPAEAVWFVPDHPAIGQNVIAGRRAASECRRVWKRGYCCAPASLQLLVAWPPLEPLEYFAEPMSPSNVCWAGERGLLRWQGQ
ncbi:hypothetical protein L3X38_033534 [Prunus dulcis]|uniref:Uncharacterized protein n=1 Tax=Prunus dulcis TaxID=3755 RepID=A0AAD4VH69_PRUDU|nr:hypothetical protein L3X38_033534 [Prunus dulcis]